MLGLAHTNISQERNLKNTAISGLTQYQMRNLKRKEKLCENSSVLRETIFLWL